MAVRRARARGSGLRARSATWRCSAVSRSAFTWSRKTSTSRPAERTPIRAGFALLDDPNDDSRHVVVRRRLAAPVGDGLEDRFDDALGGQIARSAHHLQKPLR